jgi:aryl-alcohol dehydrogenase-like predicted oxidoreductase
MDTAEMYPVPPTKETQGLTDKYIGSWMKNKRREDIVLATKVGVAIYELWTISQRMCLQELV